MESTRWWHVAVLATAGVLSVLVVLTAVAPWQVAVGLVSIAAFLATWAAIGMRADRSVLTSYVFSGMLVLVAFVGTAAVPSFATFQSIAFPLAWTRARSTRQAVVTSVALAVAVGLGFIVSTGSDANAVVQAVVIQTITLSFSLIMGFWITAIMGRSDERQRLLDELQIAQETLALVSRDAGVSSERERLAREIHDTIAQDLTGLVLLTQRARRELALGRSSVVDEQLVVLEENARLALAETRALVAASAPVGLTTGGIGQALERLGERFARETSIAVTVEVADVPPLDRDTEVVLLRCAQEALANVRKHSGAHTATLSIVSTGSGVCLTVRDDGEGFDPDWPSNGFGLDGMRARLNLVGGTLHVSSSPAGTALAATLPRGHAA